MTPTPEHIEDQPRLARFELRLEAARRRRETRIDIAGAVILGVLAIVLVIIRFAT
jgi:hypothetical protein